MTDTQGLPHNREAEEAVIGSVMVIPSNFDLASEMLRPEDFYIVRNQWVWEAFERIVGDNSKIDFVTVQSALRDLGRLEEIGGAAYLIQLINATPTAVNAVHHAEIVKQMSIRRNVIETANVAAKLAFDTSTPVEEVLSEVDNRLSVVASDHSQKESRPISDVMSDVYDNISELSQLGPDEVMGVRTGLLDVDKLLGGLQKSDLIIVAGRPGVGKTGFLLTAAKNAAQKYGKNVAFFSLEMSNDQLSHRLIAQETSISTQVLRSAKLENENWEVFTKAVGDLGGLPMILDDTPAINPSKLRAKCRQLHRRRKLDLIIVDYLQLMSGGIKTTSRVQEVSHISRSLKLLAKELHVPVLAGAQLSRAVEQRPDKKPVLSDLRESGSLEQDADIVMFIHEPDKPDYNSDHVGILKEMIVAKHRNGPVHPGIQVMFFADTAVFANAVKPGF